MRRRLALVLLAAALSAAPVRADETALQDTENPRNVRFAGPVVEYVRAEPRTEVREVGDRAAWAPGTAVRWTSVERVLPGGAPPDPLEAPQWTLDGRPRALLRGGGGGAPFVPFTADARRHEVAVAYGGDRAVAATDAMRVLVLVERRTFDAGERRFGSFARRFRKSLDDLNALLAAAVHPMAPLGVLDRFRVDEVRVYDREEGKRPEGFDDHPAFDVAVACDEGGPLAGFDLGAYSVGHNFTGPPEHRGVWSSWGEHALWHELLHFRGVQDFYLSEIAEGALPGRRKGALPLPARYARDLMASPYQAPWISEYTAVMANFRAGVARVGACEDTANKYGHVWNWLPGRLDAVVSKGGVPAAGAHLRWWRGLPRGSAGAGQGVPLGRAPDGEATCDAAGKATITGDYLGRGKPREERSLWLLVEVEVGCERRFEIVYGLDLNLAYARGDKYGHVIPLDWDRLLHAD